MQSKPKKRAQSPERTKSAEFLWHLNSPFRDEFSHLHWWKEPNAKIEMEGVIWEILRRNPMVEWFVVQLLVDWDHERKSKEWSTDEDFLKYNLDPYWQKRRPQFVEWVRLWSYKNRPSGWDYDLILESHAMDSWVELKSSTQRHWKDEIKKLQSQHGFRTDEDFLIQVMPNKDALIKALKARDTFDSRRRHVRGEQEHAMATLWDSQGAEQAKSAFCNGQIILSFDPTLPDAERILQKLIRQVLPQLRKSAPKAFRDRRKIPTIGRARIHDWLSVIESFEKLELSRDPTFKRNDQLFARYRRIIRSWKF